MKTLWKKKLSAQKCKFKHATCHQCNKEGHIASICKSSKKSHVHAVEEKFADSEENTTEEFDDYSYLYNIQRGSENPIMIEIDRDCLEIHTGSGKSSISENYLQG